jgi:RND family efflux transporter MFP subunit
MTLNRKTLWLALLLPLSLSACGHPSETKTPPPTPVKVQPLKAGTIADSSDYVATLISRQSVTLQSQVPGQIKAIYVKAGMHVAKGAPLLLLDPARQQATVGSSVAAAQSQQSQIKQVQDALKGLQEQRKALLSALAVSQSQYTRYATLFTQQSASQQDVEKYQDDLNHARANLDANQAQIQAQQASVATVQSQYRQARALTRQEQVQLQYYRITAPFAGMVGDIPVKLGNYVQPLTSLLSVTDNDPLELNLSIPSEKAAVLHVGLPVDIVDENQQHIGQTTLSFVSPNVDEATQTILTKAILKNPQGRFKADQVVNARLVWRRLPGLRIPTESVVHMGGRDFVFVMETTGAPGPNHYLVHQRPVMLGRIEGSAYIVQSGLKDGEQLVVSGIQKLSDGALVSPQAAP